MPAPSPHHDWPLTHVIRLPGNPRFLVLRSEDCVGPGRRVPSVHPWVAYFASNFAGTVFGLAIVRFCRRLGDSLARDRFAARCVRRSAAFGAHGATLVAHVRRAAADSAGLAASTAAPRAAKEIRSRRSGALSCLARAAPGWDYGDAPCELLDYNGNHTLCLARASRVRSSTSLACMAQGRA